MRICRFNNIVLLFIMSILVVIQTPLDVFGAQPIQQEDLVDNQDPLEAFGTSPAQQAVVPVNRSARKTDVQKKSDKEKAGKRFIAFDFDNVDINLFIKYISELTSKNFIVDKTVKGNVTIISPTKINEEEAYRVFESVLEVHGFTTVEAGAVIKILPTARARSQNIEMLQMGFTENPEDKVVTQLIPLKHTDPEEMKKILAPLVSKTSILIGHTRSGILIVTETLSNIQRLLGIIEAIDVEYSEEEVVVLPLENASAEAVSKIFNSIFSKIKIDPKNPRAGSSIMVVPYERINAIIALVKATEIDRVHRLVKLLDVKTERGEGNIHVFYLQNASAKELASVLNALPEQKTEAGAKGKAPAISKDVQVMPDEETNSLIITATKEEYAVLEQVIKKLDIPRRMVYLEALIMEVDTDKSFEVGVQWLTGGNFNDDTGQLATGFSGNESNPYNNLGGISATDPSLPAGFSFGLFQQGIKIGNITFPNIASILHAYKNDSKINIISTPQILTTDNKQAEISVGENIPYITSKNTTSAEQDYTQYEYKDVSTKLTITPHINQTDILRLEVATEVIKVKGDVSVTPTTYKRTADTTVIMKDKDTIVIGGIIGDDSTITEYKIPLLGDIPILGWLFKTRYTRRNRTNMFIFITPRIIKHPGDIDEVTLDKEVSLGSVMPEVQQELYGQVNSEYSQSFIDNLMDNDNDDLNNNKHQEAKQYFKEVLTVDPDNPYALLNLGAVYENEGNMENAAKVYQRIIDTDGDEKAADSIVSQDDGSSPAQTARKNLERLQKD